MEICSSYRCPVTHHKCSATLFRAKCNPHCSVLLCKRGSQQAVCHCSYTCGDLLFIQVSSDPAHMLCNTVQGKMQSPLFSAALQKRLTAGSVSLHLTPMEICSSYRCSVLLCKRGSQHLEICSSYRCPVTHHMLCNTVQGKMQSPLFSAALQKRLTAGSVSLQLHLWRFALHTGVQ